MAPQFPSSKITYPFGHLGARKARELISRREVSPVELTRAAIDAAFESQSTINAFFLIFEKEAMKAAHAAEAAVMTGADLGSLHGIPFSAKDLMSVRGARYASGSRAMAENIAAVDAPAVERAKAAGAILIGTTTTSEFGCKTVGDSPLTGITRNPWNLAMTPGGSSAGAAASVAAGITPFALGTDGGGSIRVPAAFSGLVGLKGQFGRVPVWPVSATPTLAHVGPLARTVEDAALLFASIAGYDARDPSSIPGPCPDVLGALEESIEGMRIAWSPTLGYAGPDEEVVRITKQAALRLVDCGGIVEEVDQVFSSDPADMWTSEFYAGVGTRLRSVVEHQRDLLDPAVSLVIEAAIKQDMAVYYDNVFRRYKLHDAMFQFFSKYDILISPVTPVTSLPVGLNMPEHLNDRNLVSWVFYTYPFNLTGQPAASVYVGQDSAGMPVGLQIVGRALGEVDVIRVAAAVEQSRGPCDVTPSKCTRVPN